uniref:Uncharacterized protein n=1 Tax=Tanacetum cinerariifolium TaxID=118510 RepID=A0A6L2JZX8_TANCI|nr:hypothetical protein [Tanacetum cinerariifolium]
MDSIEQCINERVCHEQVLQNTLKRLNERQRQIQQCKVQEVQSSITSLGDKTSSRMVSDEGNDQSSKNQSNTSRNKSNMSWNECYVKSTSGDDMDTNPTYDTEQMIEVPYSVEYNVFALETQHYVQPKSITNAYVVEKVDSNIIPGSLDMCKNDDQIDQNAKACGDERVVLINLIANLKLDVDVNKRIQKQLKKANASLTHELEKYKSDLEESNRALGESTSTWDTCLIALQNKQTELDKYIALIDQTIDYDILQTKLNETLRLLAQKDIEVKEGLKLKTMKF